MTRDSQTEQSNADIVQTEQDLLTEQPQQEADLPLAVEEQFATAQPSDFLQQTDNGKQRRRKVMDRIITALLVVLIVVLSVTIVLKGFVISRISVSGSSMMPNYQDRQIVWVDKTATPKRGDVVILYKHYVKNKFVAEFTPNGGGRDGKYEKLIKRVVALGGDSLWVEEYNGDYVLVIKTAEGEIIREDYYTVNGQPAQFWDASKQPCDFPTLGLLGLLSKYRSEENCLTVPQGNFYFLGDNRHDSTDSRILGSMPLSHIYGVVK